MQPRFLAAFAVLSIIVTACNTTMPNITAPAASSSSASPLIAVALASPTALPSTAPTLTSTPTRIIGAVEATPTASAKRGEVWDVVITSKTSRQYFDFQKGTLLNTCFTNWRYSLFYVVAPNGTIKGHGYGVTQTPLNCTPHPLPNSNLVLTEEEVLVNGTQDSKTLKLQLGVASIKPNPSGDNGGVVLLFNNGACPPDSRTIEIPVNGQTRLVYRINDFVQMTGCAGSAKDIMQADSLFEVERDFDCANVPPNFDQTILDLCK